MRRLVLVGASTLLPACLLFTSLDGASGGADPSENDGGTNDGNASAESGSADAASSDTSTDGGGPAPGPGFCAQDAGPGVILCSEFSGTDVSDGFTGLAGGVGSLELDNGNMLAKVPLLGQYEEGKNVYQVVNGAFSSLKCSFAFRRDVIGEEDVSVAELLVETGAEFFTVGVYTAPTFGRLLLRDYPADGGDGTGSESPADLHAQVGEWHRIAIEATDTQVRAYVDDQLNASLPHQAPAAPLKTTFKLGIPQIDGDNTAAWELRFDDVRCIRTP